MASGTVHASRTVASTTDVRSGFADALEHGGGDGIFRRAATPDEELEGREEALAFRQADFHQVLDLLGGGTEPTAQQQRLAEPHHALLDPTEIGRASRWERLCQYA